MQQQSISKFFKKRPQGPPPNSPGVLLHSPHHQNSRQQHQPPHPPSGLASPTATSALAVGVAFFVIRVDCPSLYKALTFPSYTRMRQAKRRRVEQEDGDKDGGAMSARRRLDSGMVSSRLRGLPWVSRTLFVFAHAPLFQYVRW